MSEPVYISPGQNLINALNAHAVKRTNVEEFHTIMANVWLNMKTCVVAGDTTPAGVIIACCSYNSTIQKTLLGAASRERFAPIITEAHTNWLALQRINQNNMNLVQDLYQTMRGY